MPPLTAAKTERSPSKSGDNATAVVTISLDGLNRCQLAPPSQERNSPLLHAAKQALPPAASA